MNEECIGYHLVFSTNLKLLINGGISFFVSPELSSGRDLVIQMSVRRVPCAVRRPSSMVFCPEHISETV